MGIAYFVLRDTQPIIRYFQKERYAEPRKTPILLRRLPVNRF